MMEVVEVFSVFLCFKSRLKSMSITTMYTIVLKENSSIGIKLIQKLNQITDL